DRREREPRGAPERAPRVACVAPRRLEPDADARVAGRLLDLVDAAEGDRRLAPRRLRLQALRDLAARQRLEGGADLLVELRVQRRAVRQRAPRAREAGRQRHAPPSSYFASSPRAIATTMRSHCFLSRSSCRRPAGSSRYVLTR